MVCRIAFAVILLILGSVPAQGSYFFTPVGHQEAFLGNAGSALLCSSGSPLYNPASMGFCENFVNISVSGTAIAYQEMEGTAFYRETGSLKSSTLLTSAIFSVDDKIHMGFYYTYPTNIQDYFRLTNPDGSIRTQEIQRQNALAGIAYGGLLSPNLGWGFSIGMTWSELNSTLTNTSSNAGTARLFNERRMQEEQYLVLNPGFLWQADEDYSVALTMQWRALNLYGEGDVYQAELSTGQTQVSETFDRYSPHADSILGFTLGQAWHLQNHLLVADISYAPRYALAMTPEKQKSDLNLFNVSLGWQSPFINASSLRTGFSYSAIDKQNVYLAMGGIGFNKRTFQATLGIYYQYTENKNVGAINSDILGFLYSSAINY